MHLVIHGHEVTANISVSPTIDKLLLCSDWLVANQCRWDFTTGTAYIGDQLIHAHQRMQVDAC